MKNMLNSVARGLSGAFEAPSIRRQREIDEARARKKKEKEQKKLAEKLAIEAM